MKKLLTIIGISLSLYGLYAFCGFYVAKADAKLFNKSSQVIIARDGSRTVVSMESDFEGDAKDFAMVVPVPEVLKEKDIKVVSNAIFEKMDGYSGPRLVEYYDQNPCNIAYNDRAYPEMATKMSATSMDLNMVEEAKDFGVKIEAKYSVEEYDILILSGEESSGLKKWLVKNGYNIPEGAEEVLDPYIKNNLKFFVVKVDMKKFTAAGYQKLRPIQISYSSNNFMLPIRLGMANAKDDQDLVIYAFTKNGRIETTNYRTVEIPSNKNIPTFIKNKFGEFYTDVFGRAHRREGRNAVFIEYAWDLSGSNFVKCDPCATTPPVLADLQEAGVFWAERRRNNSWGGSEYDGEIFFTRMHVRYNRRTFPQDLLFQVTPNKASFQARYIMTHPATGSLECEAAQQYLKGLVERRKKELSELASLTGSKTTQYKYYVEQYEKLIKEPVLEYQKIEEPKDDIEDQGIIIPPTDNLEGNDVSKIENQQVIEPEVKMSYQPVSAEYPQPSQNEKLTAGAGAANKILFLLLIVCSVFYIVRAFYKSKLSQ